MRSIVDFYRRNPLVLALALGAGLALSLFTAVVGGSGLVGPIVLAVVIGVLVGLGVAAARAGDDEDDLEVDADDPRFDR